MDRDRRLSLTVGGLFLASIIVMAVVILSLSSQSGVWAPRYQLVAYWGNVQGLISGAPVWLAGKNVGRVESVSFSELEAERPAVVVVLQVDEDVQARIRSDSVAHIGTIGVLGDSYVEIAVGTSSGTVLEDGEELATLDPVDLNSMLAKGANALDIVAVKGAKALDGIADLAQNLNTTIASFNIEESGAALSKAVVDVGDIVAEVKTGNGVLHSLVYDDFEADAIASLETSIVTLEDILETVRHGEGVLHSLVYDPAEENPIAVALVDAGDSMNRILRKIDEGDGTLGLLVNDPTLYEDTKLLVGGANRSALVRGMVRMLSTEEDE